MSLSTGSKLGPYEVLSRIGAGGMGQVYLAKDTRLDREVAIKVLPAHFAANPERKQRFEREARAISSLTHPNICTLHDVGNERGVDYLVMEYLEGETLAERIAKGPMPPDEVLLCGRQIASALEAAHRQGVVHRDLKPGNIILTKGGAKLLDFGLAKAVTIGRSEPDARTMTRNLTGEGAIVGTFQYMAPEQLEGKPVDERTDIFAFGAVLYEMATGKPAFTGKSQASLISSIMAGRPTPISELQPMTPPALDHVVRSCLAKDPDDRIQSAHDVRLHLEWVAEGGSHVSVPAPVAAHRRRRQRQAWATACVFGVVAVVFGVLYGHLAFQTPQVILSSITPPSDVRFSFVGLLSAGPLALSPDGREIAFVAVDETGSSRLWIRSLASTEARSLPGTGNATNPFWSADSRSVGFFAGGKLKRIDAAGGPAVTLCPAPNGRGGTWNGDGAIVFAPHFQSPLHRVSASGGPSTPITEIDSSKHSSHRWPEFLPDGEHYLYLAVKHNPTSRENDGVYFASLNGGETKFLFRTHASVRYASGYLLFVREGTLMAQRFDPRRGRLSGKPAPIADSVQCESTSWAGVYSASQNGLLAYQTGNSTAETNVVWFDRDGKEIGTIGQPGLYFNVRLSPDDQHLAVSLGEGIADIWVFELARGIRTRLTFDPIIQLMPIWSPDGNDIVFSQFVSKPSRVTRQSSRGVGRAEVLMEDDEAGMIATDWSSDGKYLLYLKGDVFQQADNIEIWAKPMDADESNFPVLRTPFRVSHAAFSPDVRWIAYSSDEAGRREVYVIPFAAPEPDAPAASVGEPASKWQVSVNGGFWPVWRADGKELFYVTLNKRIMAAQVDGTTDGFVVTTVSPLFTVNIPLLTLSYDVSNDGQRFVIDRYADEKNTPVTLVTNWPASIPR